MTSIQFKGKSAIWNHHLSVPYHTLDSDKKLCATGSFDSENLIIQGDNLLALKALLPKYQGKIKCVYIDPPYNTGNENWIYSDNVNSPTIRDWLGKAVGRENEDLVRHDKWLCMMTPRLKLLRELMSEDGAIFISIDDNEQHNLRLLMNEIFGEENFLAQFIWNKKNVVQNDAKFASTNHEYIVSYRKSPALDSFNLLARTQEADARYENPDNDPRGPWTSVALQAKSGSSSGIYSITFPNGVSWTPVAGTFPRLSKDSLMKAFEEGRIWFGAQGKNVPRLKKYLSEVRQGMVTNSLLFNEDVGSTQSAKEHLKRIMGENSFDTPKPVKLICHLISLACGPNDIVLDSFAGSGTTAEAVLTLNEMDQGERRYILVEMEDYAESITAQRVRRVVEASSKRVGFSYMRLGQAIDIESMLQGGLPRYEELAKYVYYLTTGKHHPRLKDISATKQFIGKHNSLSLWLIYEDNIEALKSMAITLDWARKAHGLHKGNKVVFAPACYLDEDFLAQYNIKFVGIPFNLFEHN